MNSYVTLKEFKKRLSIDSSSADSTLLEVIEASSRNMDRYTQRWFFEQNAVRYFDGVSNHNQRITFRHNYRVILDPFYRLQNPDSLATPDLIEVDSIKTDEDQDQVYESTWKSTDYYLSPNGFDSPTSGSDNSKPYTGIITNPNGGQSVFPVGTRVIEITGKWGYWRQLLPKDALTVELAAGVTSLEASCDVGETLRIEDEQIYVMEDITPDGGAETYRIVRGVNGTTDALHASGASVSVYKYPASVRESTFLQAARLYRRKDASIIEESGLLETGRQSIQIGMDIEIAQYLSPFVRRRSHAIL